MKLNRALIIGIFSLGVLGIGAMVISFFLLGAPTGFSLSGDKLMATGYEHEEWLWLRDLSYGFFALATVPTIILILRLNRQDVEFKAGEAQSSEAATSSPRTSSFLTDLRGLKSQSERAA